MPAPIGLAATWDSTAARQYGDLLGREAWATGHNVVLGPQLDIARIPVFGRLFEALGEDPQLAGQIAVSYIRGIQSHPVVATAKHYQMNTQEENRFEVDAQLDERTLQEIYTPAFAAAVQDGQVGSVMGAFNKVNGSYSCENRHLLTDILKHQLGFQGWVMSDYEAVHSTVETANAGLDQEMPNGIFFSDRLMEAIQTGQVSVATLDDKVDRILRTMFACGLFDQPVQITPFPEREHGKVAREIASKGIVLLKNADGLLPLASHEVRSIAVIGADADTNIAGGGSSVVQPTYVREHPGRHPATCGRGHSGRVRGGYRPCLRSRLAAGAASATLFGPDANKFRHGSPRATCRVLDEYTLRGRTYAGTNRPAG